MLNLDRPKSKNYHSLRSSLKYLFPYRKVLFFSALALLFTAGVTLSLGQGIRHLIDAGFSARSKEELFISLAVIAGIGLLMAIGTYVRHYTVSWIGERVSSDLKLDVFSHILTLPPSFFELNSPGEIQSRIVADTTILQTVFGSSASIALRNVLMFCGGIVFLFFTNIKLTLIILLSVPFVVFPILFFGKRVRRLSRDTQDRIANVGSYVSEALLNIKVLQSFTHEEIDRIKFKENVEQSFQTSVARIRQRSLLISSVILLILLGICFMLWVGGLDVLEGRISAGELTSFAFYSIMVASSMGALSEVLGDLQRASGATERLMELLNAQSDILSVPSESIQQYPPPKGEIHFHSVSFSYPSRPEQSILKEIKLQIPAKKTTAIVGPSGAGKSTLFELLLRFYDPESGQIEIDGINIQRLPLKEYRSMVSFVPQSPILFSGSLYENILYGNPLASEEMVKEAAEKAYVTEFLSQLPNSWDTDLGHLGSRLSGGQKQRIAIARAIVKNPLVLLLDEATSALDSQSEQMIQKALDGFSKERTTIMIAHRLSTILKADQIVVLNQGRVENVGTHEELISSSKLYARLAELQFNTEEFQNSFHV
ncbi:ABC transporter permease/ATP-binding protein [Leptospira ryugenii]|uniref:ABC transporter permease/ATP-binding protein n=1 Tax=Leptospira ryugenii TaxID=1917863 RepID=A0A2P2E371_9LEPT|nr:ABC transporter transmembrane domain-containing protein [Leptospira ryugenii]GBF51342.1 ABC transporter permease/ATP-binding protein [Leptospira ryugenii]